MRVAKYWERNGFPFFEVNTDEGYIRISRDEFDIPGAIVIILDAFGAFEIYKVGRNDDKLFAELSYEENLIISEGLVRTWKELGVDWFKDVCEKSDKKE